MDSPMTAISLHPGAFRPLGATWDGHGTSFAIYTENATAVELCLFDTSGRETSVQIPWHTLHVWHVYIRGIGPGQRYGWRVHGPFSPNEGHRFNPNKLLVDPYARALDGFVDLRGPICGYPHDRGLDDRSFDDRDDAAHTIKSVVADERFDWGSDRPPRVPWEDTLVYELHVKGFTERMPLLDERERGTYLGLASDASIAHLQSLGVTTVELMPVHEHVDELNLALRGKTNYWGYSTLSYFAPDRRFATVGGDAMVEFKQMVKRLHAAGIEVVLDVVYNHTCEGDERGPTLSFRGIDNSVYYRLEPADPRHYVDFSGCGNTLNATHPQVLQLVTDSLRYWVTDMHVDGFRFDLAPTLSRDPSGGVDRLATFFFVIHQDPVLSRIKLIAEPWDLGAGGYQVGQFPILWSEWNGRYRDTVRSFWKGQRGAVADLASRVSGSSDLFAHEGRHPQASINFVTAHDGFTLRDLVSYEHKHNEANGENNRDGLDDNSSQNCGIEGDSADPAVCARRHTLARSLLATLFLSQGVPMLEMGDETWRTQLGNNNPFCHDSELTWIDWNLGLEASEMLAFTRELSALRKRHINLRRRRFLRGVAAPVGRGKDITWLRTDGTEMGQKDWTDPQRGTLAFRLDGDAIEHTPGSSLVHDDSLLVMMNGEPERTVFYLPRTMIGARWQVALDTSEAPRIGLEVSAGQSIVLGPGCLILLVEAGATK